MTTNEHPVDTNRAFRRQIYALMIMIGAGLCLGRIIAVDNVKDRSIQEYRYTQIPKELEARRLSLEAQGWDTERIEKKLTETREKLYRDYYSERPFLSANDRSRFCTIRVLVEPKLRETRTFEKDGKTYTQVVPYAIDKIRAQKGWDSIDVVCHTLEDDPSNTQYLFSSKPPLLPTIMAVPYWVIYKTTGHTFDTSRFDRYLITRIMLIICHLIPLVIGWFLMAAMIDRLGKSDWGRIFAVAFTCFATFLSTFVITLNNHLPAVFCIIVAMYAAVRIWFDGDTRLRWFALAAFFSALAFTCDLPSGLVFGFLGLILLIRYPRQTLIAGVPMAAIVLVAFFVTNYIAHQTIMPAYSQREWYLYEYQKEGYKSFSSYWNNPQGPDQGEESRLVYAYNCTFGHHGFFSLTPVWLLGIVGLGMMLAQKREARFRHYAIFVIVISLICFFFYLSMSLQNRNYGGMTCGPRWSFWLIPFWTIALLPTLDIMSKNRFARWCGLLLLIISAMSVTYPLWNPWSPPWLEYLSIYWK